MILTDREIQTAIKKGVIIIDPAPRDNAYSSTSVDLTLDQYLTIFKTPVKGVDITFDPAMREADTETLLESVTTKTTIPVDGYVLKTNELVLAYSKEYIDLRLDTKYAARVEGKSSFARIGLSIHVTAPTIHAGYHGRIRLEMVNHGPLPIKPRANMAICQLIFEQTLGTPDKGYSGQFSGQGPV